MPEREGAGSTAPVLEVTGLRNAHALRAVVTSIAGKNRVFMVINRANRAGGLSMASIVKGLGGKPDIVIPDLGKGMTEAVNLGIPALKHVRKLRRHLAPIVQEIAAVGVERALRVAGNARHHRKIIRTG